MTIHSEDRQVLIRGRDGVLFPAAVTHLEKKGAHLVVIATPEEHLPRLRRSAPTILALLGRCFGASPGRTRYFERGRDGAAFEVDTKLASVQPAGDPAPGVRRGVWRDERLLLRRLGGARLPSADPTPEMKQALAAEVSPQARQADPPLLRTRTQRPRHPRPY